MVNSKRKTRRVSYRRRGRILGEREESSTGMPIPTYISFALAGLIGAYLIFMGFALPQCLTACTAEEIDDINCKLNAEAVGQVPAGPEYDCSNSAATSDNVPIIECGSTEFDEMKEGGDLQCFTGVANFNKTNLSDPEKLLAEKENRFYHRYRNLEEYQKQIGSYLGDSHGSLSTSKEGFRKITQYDIFIPLLVMFFLLLVVGGGTYFTRPYLRTSGDRLKPAGGKYVPILFLPLSVLVLLFFYIIIWVTKAQEKHQTKVDDPDDEDNEDKHTYVCWGDPCERKVEGLSYLGHGFRVALIIFGSFIILFAVLFSLYLWNDIRKNLKVSERQLRLQE